MINVFTFYLTGELKGGYLDFSHLTELKNIYITEVHMKKQYKSSITIRIIELKIKSSYDGVPLKGYIASIVIFGFWARNKKKKHCGRIK